jgi:light-regulated signal transduction histidine kinase (bacteriophytochrome)
VPEDRDGFAHAFEEAARTGRFFVECRVIHPDQSIHWIQAQGKVIGYEAGRPARMLGTVVDISKQRQAMDTLEALSRALERSNIELEQFAYVASHDLQEPLRMVVGYVQLLERRLADKLDADAREFMAYAVDGAMRMQVMIEDILAYSRVTTKAQPLAPVDSAAALQEALDRLAGQIKVTGAEVDVQPLPTVMADRSQLVQLFQNLVGNAIKFCKDRAPRVRVQAAHEAGRWRFSVTDNGIGIAPEYRAQLFVIFRRLHTQREYPGTGIGLAICKRIIERHGGEIGIDAAPGGGAVFWFTLPEEHAL